MHDLWKIAGGRVYDPASNVEGEVRDVWIRGGKVVAPPKDDSGERPARVYDASGMVVMPGGVDMHCHIAGPKVNIARKMRPDEKRNAPVVPRTARTHSGTLGSVPSTFATGYKYLALGYTTAFDAAVPPIGARHAHEELIDTPCIDKGFFTLVGNHLFALECLREGEHERLRDFLAWLLAATRAHAPKLVNPGGVELWKQRAGGNIHHLDDTVDGFGVSARQIIQGIARAANELGLPHPVHLHCNNLGLPGNAHTTLDTMRSLDGLRAHLAHIQFHSYGGGEGDENTFNSQTPALVEYVNQHANLSVDVGQVLFGDTTSMTGDGPLGYYLHNVYGGKWYSGDTELECGCGIAPIKYRNKSLVHAVQWAAGLEWLLLADDPWRVVLSTDHPNGGSFLAYPQIIRLLMDRTFRQEVMKTLPDEVHRRTTLADLDREFTLGEIAIITRAGPARLLGLPNKGHLALGADADITIYTPHENPQVMFELPRCVIKAGRILAEEGEIRDTHDGKTLHVSPDYDAGVERTLRRWFEDYSTIQFRNFPVSDAYTPHAEVTPCRK